MAKHAAHGPRDTKPAATESAPHAPYRPDDGSSEYPDAFEGLEPVDSGPMLFDEETVYTQPVSVGSHGKPKKPQLSPVMRKSRRTRRILIAITVLLVVLIGALCYFGYRLLVESGSLASQQAQEQQGSQDVDAMSQEASNAQDTTITVTKTARVPELDMLLGMAYDDAVAELGSDAVVTSERDADEADRPIMTMATLTITGSSTESRSGIPTVYLGLDSERKVIEAGFSASTSSLGFAPSSFSDAVTSDGVIENAMAEAGVAIDSADVVLPEDRSTYATYADDGKTVVKERCAFSGTVSQNSMDIEWSAVLMYDYTTSNATGNIASTIRLIYLYLDAPSLAAPVPEPEPEPAEEPQAEGGQDAGGEGEAAPGEAQDQAA